MKTLGIDFFINVCDCCGRENLKFTVIVEGPNGIENYGKICATKKGFSPNPEDIKEGNRLLNKFKTKAQKLVNNTFNTGNAIYRAYGLTHEMTRKEKIQKIAMEELKELEGQYTRCGKVPPWKIQAIQN